MDPQNASTRAFTGDRSPARAAVDNVMRRSLKISNPYDPAEVAKGLLARYGDEAERIKREQQGLPFSVMQAQPPSVPQTNGTGRPEMRRASDAIEAALKELTTSPDLADIQPELSGWASMIRRACADGFASASSDGSRAMPRRSIPAPPRSIAVSPRPAILPPTSCWW